MSDDEADPELLELLRQSLGLGKKTRGEISNDTGVLKDAEYIYSNAIDVSVDMYGTKAAAAEIYNTMQQKSYSTESWKQHELHPKPEEGFSELDMLNFIFTMDLLNYSFWSDLPSEERYQVEYRGKRWVGYNSLVACLRRAIDEGVPISTPRFWRSNAFTDEVVKSVFRSATNEQMPLVEERIATLREAGDVLKKSFPSDDSESETERDAENPSDDCHEGNASLNSMRIDSNGAEATDTNAAPVVANGNAALPDADLSPSTVARQQSAQDLLMDEEGETGESTRADIAGPPHEVTEQNDRPMSMNESQATSNDRPEIVPSFGRSSELATHSPESISDMPVQQDISDQDLPQATQHIVQPAETTIDVSAPQNGTVQQSLSRIRNQPPDHAVARLIQRADKSAGKLVNLLAHHFPSFRDETRFDGRKVRLLKRAQILVADVWAALNGTGLGEFHDIDHLTMFAGKFGERSSADVCPHRSGYAHLSERADEILGIPDYRVPQVLHSLGVLTLSPPLHYHIQNLRRIEPGHSWEVQLRGCSIWAVQMIKREILREHPDANVNAVLIDFFLYDLAKEKEAQGQPTTPHHRTRSIWY